MTSMMESTGTVSHRRRTVMRLGGVAAATAAAAVVWAVAELVLDIDLRRGSTDIGAVGVIATAAGASLAGWGLLALLERFSERGGRLWARIAATFAVVSTLGPVTTPGIEGAELVVLPLLHLVVGAVLIPMLYRTTDDV